MAVTSGKGGVGKTVLSANLAAALARRGERVLVLDADLGLANLDVVLGLMPRTTLHDVFTGTAELDRAIVPAPGNFSVLLAGSGLVEYSRLMPDVRLRLMEVIDTLAPRYDRILIDTGAGISDVVLHAVSLAGEVLVVATSEPTSMTDAYAIIKVLALHQQRARMRLVVNQTGRPGRRARRLRPAAGGGRPLREDRRRCQGDGRLARPGAGRSGDARIGAPPHAAARLLSGLGRGARRDGAGGAARALKRPVLNGGRRRLLPFSAGRAPA